MKPIDGHELGKRIRECTTLTDYTKQIIMGYIYAAPVLDVEPVKHAFWTENHRGYYECSECGCEVRNFNNYCPNCGAKMDLPRRWC